MFANLLQVLFKYVSYELQKQKSTFFFLTYIEVLGGKKKKKVDNLVQ